MTTLLITDIPDAKPVRLTVELPAAVYRDLSAYAEALTALHKKTATPPQLIAPMIEQFILSDRTFLRWRQKQTKNPSSQSC
ncbi:DUF2274 domain-containing protein [Acidomonas methanolica]|uniref:DUF2274 domain-containing protein n=1 Tax=Acidomonas methanolica TaxID=437 RepID=UPI0009DE591D|nr:DUF2274 domain-containing protein [Acidomonas methanolica]GBQ46120.1 hypothetical protein AA0498_0216 [Acidomonas methanolica]